MSLEIGYEDHYSYFDRRVSVYNFLRYSENVWKLFNPSLHFQNRLRHCDYSRMFHDERFAIVAEHCCSVSEEDLTKLGRITVDDRFKAYSLQELAVRDGRFVLRKAND